MRRNVLSIAGFDPSGGAGILADIKTFEQIGVQGFGVCTTITFQREDKFDAVHWLTFKQIKKQLDILLEKHSIEFCKIGLIENIKTLKKTINYLNKKKIKIVFDPILKASAGFEFHNSPNKITNLLEKTYLITPNYNEFKSISQKNKLKKAAKQLSKKCNILLKGGHNKKEIGTDYLFTKNDVYKLIPKKEKHYPKHGSGCILSAAIIAYLTLGNDLHSACKNGKKYVSKALRSNESLLAYHNHNINNPRAETVSKKMIDIAFKSQLQYISQGKKPKNHLINIEEALKGGCKWIQLRLKNSKNKTIKKTALKAKMLCEKYNAVLIINDNVKIAKEISSDGVHLGKEDMKPSEARKILGNNKIIGGTANTFNDIKYLNKQAVDYIGLGPFRFTSTKKKLSPILGLEGYRFILDKMVKKNIVIPVFAIGGITENDISKLMQTGISGIAVSGLITNEKDKSGLIKRIKRKTSLNNLAVKF